MTGAPDGSQALRALVREVLADLLPPGTAPSQRDFAQPGTAQPGAAQPAAGPGAARPGPVPAGPAQPGAAHTVHESVAHTETVSLRTDADLAAFVMRLLHLFENHQRRDALRAGRLRFRLAAPAGPGSPQPSHRVEKGAVTEAMVAAAARDGARLVLGRRAVLTPLARDRARSAGVEIEKER